jgi:hypothetical protein
LAGAGWRFRAEVVAPLDTSSDSIESRRAALNWQKFRRGDTQRVYCDSSSVLRLLHHRNVE